MKYIAIILLLLSHCVAGFCQNNKSVGVYEVPDSIKAIGYYGEVSFAGGKISNKTRPGISVNNATLSLDKNEGQKNIRFLFSGKTRNDISFGSGVYQLGRGNAWNYDWKENETYPLLIVTAADSASHLTIYSGYIYLPAEKKWKLISTRLYPDTNRVTRVGPNITGKYSNVTYSNRWLMRSNNTWKALDSQTTGRPVLRPMSNIDSLAQQQLEEENLRAKLPADSANYKDGIFYQVLKAGNGRQVLVTDTVVIHYKGWLFGNGNVFDETKEKPATFPLQRLIRGWQVGLPQCRVGGKIRLFIPSGSAFGIRTFATDIPPNNTLVFDVEVLEVKEKVQK